MIPYGRQDIDEADVAAVAAAMRGDFLTTGPQVDELEEDLRGVTHAPHVVACSNGTAALHLAALAAGVGEGGYAIVPSVTFLATANAMRLAGGEVWFADVDAGTGLLGPEQLERAIAQAARHWPGRRLRAVAPVHLNGQACDVAALVPLAAAHGAMVVEDACHAFGGMQYLAGERPGIEADLPVGACRHADLATFSFHPVKAIAMGEGGAIAARDPALAGRMKRLRSHGMERDPARHELRDQGYDESGRPNPWYYEMPEVGLNYRAPDILCALARSQLRRLAAFLAHRAALAGRYRAALAASPAPMQPLPLVPHGRPAWHLAVALVDFAAAGVGRGEAMRRLRASGYGTQVHYLPVHRQPYYIRRYGTPALPGADAYYARCLSLPFHMGVGLDEADRVVAALETALRS